MSDQLDMDLETAEGLRLFVYDDATGKSIVPGTIVIGHPSIGYGRALDLHGISKDEALLLLHNSENEVYLALERFSWFNNLSPMRKIVIEEMAYNLGVGNVLNFKNMIDAIVAQDWQSAANEILKSKAAMTLPKRYSNFASEMLAGLPATGA